MTAATNTAATSKSRTATKDAIASLLLGARMTARNAALLAARH